MTNEEEDFELYKKIKTEFELVADTFFNACNLPLHFVIAAVHEYISNVCLAHEISPDIFKKGFQQGFEIYEKQFQRIYGNESATE